MPKNLQGAKVPISSPSSRSKRAEPRAIDFDRYIPTVVGRLSVTLRASAKLFFQSRFGISLLDWRIISFLVSEGPSSAYDIWTLGSLDKAAVSRAIQGLAAKEIISVRTVPRHARRRAVVTLTKKGRTLHDATFSEIVERHRRLLGDLTKTQVESFIVTAQYLEGRVALMDKDSAQSFLFGDPTKNAFAERK